MMNMVKHSTVDAVNAQLCWQILYFGLEPIEPITFSQLFGWAKPTYINSIQTPLSSLLVP
jgi:hypothetical protein